jgi:hypothetical protein
MKANYVHYGDLINNLFCRLLIQLFTCVVYHKHKYICEYMYTIDYDLL